MPRRTVSDWLRAALRGSPAGGCGARVRRFSSSPADSWNAAHPVGYWASSGALYRHREPPRRSNRWLLHPWLPVDIRLPAIVGVGGAGLYIYVQQNPDEAVSRNAQYAWDTSSSAISTIRSAVQGPGAPKAAAAPPPTTDNTSATPPPSEQPLATQSTPTDAPQPVDITPMVNILNEALTDFSSAAAGSDPRPPAASAAPADTHTPPAAPADGPRQPPTAHDVMTAASELVEKVGAAYQALHDKAYLNTVAPGASTVAETRQTVAGAGSPEQSERVVLHTAGLLGLPEDISSQTLLEHASAEGLRSDRSPQAAAHKQAVADTELLKKVLQGVSEYHQRSLAEAHAQSSHWETQAHEQVALAAEAVEATVEVLEQERARADAAQHRALATQELEMQVEAERSANEERTARHAALDGLRDNLNGLKMALDARSEQLQRSALAHRVSSALATMCTALGRGAPIVTEVVALGREQDDPLVHAVLKSLPEKAAKEGIVTLDALREQWPQVKRAVRVRAALAPGAEAGLLSTMVAGAAARLKVSERSSLGLSLHSQSLECQLAAVDDAMARGELACAVALLEELETVPQAAAVCERFRAAAHARAVADQAVVLLRAHTSALAMAAS